ncbi:hypothetical protein MC7420_3388 [Coleofasciculus chthonoplastes PCC 7420]|uniref:Uncharacterized protein n=1 Tax=Coleofasciculus chthonoplastes PCC 7420 TaxID=118168 RepID=B4W3C0_9CYAN|nr:hypothetical protein MC7420_3388 [Coleofasciculus chthonoplastes PCC 7420]
MFMLLKALVAKGFGLVQQALDKLKRLPRYFSLSSKIYLN